MRFIMRKIKKEEDGLLKMKRKRNYWIWLSTVEGLGPVRKKRLLDRWQSPEAIYHASREELLECEGITEDLVQKIEESKQEEMMLKYENYIAKNRIHVVNITDEIYPEKLRQIYDPPITLFGIGNLALLAKVSIGIVGSRNPSTYGMQVAQFFAKELSEKGVVIVSGMAKGIDAAAHKGTFSASYETIAVLRKWS